MTSPTSINTNAVLGEINNSLPLHIIRGSSVFHFPSAHNFDFVQGQPWTEKTVNVCLSVVTSLFIDFMPQSILLIVTGNKPRGLKRKEITQIDNFD